MCCSMCAHWCTGIYILVHKNVLIFTLKACLTEKEQCQILSVKLARTVPGKLISVGQIPWNHSNALLLFRYPINLYRTPLTLVAAAFPYRAKGRCEQRTVAQGFRSNPTELILGLWTKQKMISRGFVKTRM